MLWAYFDEAIIAERRIGFDEWLPTEIVVGGCIAAQDEWEKFTVRWTKALREVGVRMFCATDFYAFKGEFKWLDPEGRHDLKRHRKFRDELADIIVDHVAEAISFTSTVSMSSKGIEQSYEDAALHAVYDFTNGIKRQEDLRYIVLARHPELNPWSIIRRFENFDWQQRLAGVGNFRPDDVPPLQAADFVLHSLNRRWKGEETESFKRLSDGLAKRNKGFRTQTPSTLNPNHTLLK